MRLRYPFAQHQRVSQKWAENPAFYAPMGLAGHSGIDYAVPVGTPVLAMHDGAVTILDQGSQYYGLQVRLIGDGYFTLYGHLSDTVLPQGRTVKAGELIGRSGNSGLSTGPHTHIALSIDGVRIPGYGIWSDITPYIQEEETMASRLTWHFQQPTSWAAEVVAASGAHYCKQLFFNGQEPDLFPAQLTIARCWIGGDGVEAEYIKRGAAGANDYYADLLPVYTALRGKVYAVESTNEPAVATPEQRASLGAFTKRWVQHMRGAGWFEPVVGNFSSGTPDVTQPTQIQELEGVFTCGAILGLHQYSRGRLDSSDASWYILRHRRLFERLTQWGWAIPQTIITEAGYDYQGKGWREHVNWPEYFRELVWLDQQLQADPQILAACIFNSGGTPDWASFEVGEAESRDLSAYMRANASADLPPVTPPKPTLAEVVTEWITRRQALLDACDCEQALAWTKLHTALATLDAEMRDKLGRM
jgi:hypothetical protein